MEFLVAAVVLLGLHNVDGDEIFINIEQIVTLLHGHDNKESIAPGINCIIGLSNGRRVSVVEHCATIRQSIQQHERGISS